MAPPIIAGPFGLFGFALATIVLNMANAKIFPLNSMNLAMGLALGAGLQGVGALIALYQKSFFSALAFFGYAFFWLSYVLIFVFSPAPLPPPNPLALGLYLIVWLLFTICMTVCVWKPKSTWAIRILFLTVDILFALLAITDFLKAAGATDFADTMGRIAGAEGIICGFLALYTAMAETMNPVYGKTILPLGEIEAPVAKTEEAAVPLTQIRTDPEA